MFRVPIGVKREIIEDFERQAALPNDPTHASARAALNVVFANTARYTDKIQSSAYLRSLIKKSAQDGSLIAVHMGNLMEITLCDNSTAPACSAYTLALRATIKALAKSEYPPLKEVGHKPTLIDLLNAARKQDCAILVAHYAVLYQITADLPAKYVNTQRSTTGETPLALACRLGDHIAAQHLLNLGADPSIRTFDNCSPMHWLFMFDDAHMLEVDLDYHDASNIVCNRPATLDAQAPIDLKGSPLSFAVASASVLAVAIIISAPYTIQPSITRQAWCLASSLHLHELMELLPTEPEPDLTFRSSLHDIVRSSRVITKLMHGSNVEDAQRLTLTKLFCTFSSLLDIGGKPVFENSDALQQLPEAEIQQKIRSIELKAVIKSLLLPGLEPAIRANELGIAYQLLEQFVTDFPSTEPFISILGAPLSSACAQTSCDSTYDDLTSFGILEFSFSLCAELGFERSWFDAITTAIQAHRLDIFDWLMKKHHHLAELNFKTDTGNTILHVALLHGFTKLRPVCYLLSQGCDPNITNSDGYSPLDFAAQLGLNEEFDCLLQKSSETRCYRPGCQTPLHSAVQNRNSPMLSKLLRHSTASSMLDLEDENGMSPLILAASQGFVDGVAMLLKAEARIALCDGYGRTALHHAVLGNSHAHFDVLRKLLVRPLGVNAVDRDGNTPLHLAVVSQARLNKPDWSICEDMINANARLDIANKLGYLPFTLALRLCDTTTFLPLLPHLLGLDPEKDLYTVDIGNSLRAHSRYHEQNAAITIDMIQANPYLFRQALVTKCLQATFDQALESKMTTIIYHFLLRRFPVRKHALCEPEHAHILASAIFNLREDIVECYEEFQGMNNSSAFQVSTNIDDVHVPGTQKSLWEMMQPRALEEVERLLILDADRVHYDGPIRPDDTEYVLKLIRSFYSKVEGYNLNGDPLKHWKQYQDVRNSSRPMGSRRSTILTYRWKFREITHEVLKSTPEQFVLNERLRLLQRKRQENRRRRFLDSLPDLIPVTK